MQTEEPWYRQFWPWVLVVLPGSVVVASFVTAWIAFSAPDPVVRDEYDRNGFEAVSYTHLTLPTKA